MAKYFEPSHEFHLITESKYNQMILSVESTLAGCEHTGTFEAFDGIKISYCYYLVKEARANIVIVHGFTEFYKKYSEIAWYFLNQGYNVFLYDQRSHGLSESTCEDPNLVHVDSVYDYVNDLADYVDKIIIPAGSEDGVDRKTFLYSHSMGGTVGALYLADPRCHVARAILSSPMVRPYTNGVPNPIVLKEIQAYVKRHGGWKTRFPHAHDFTPNAVFHKSADGSRPRFEHNLKLRIDNPCYQPAASTNAWMYESLTVKEKMFSKETTENIKVPVLMFFGGKDQVVRERLQVKFAKQISTATYHVYPKAKHTLYTQADENLPDYYHRIFAFYEEEFQ